MSIRINLRGASKAALFALLYAVSVVSLSSQAMMKSAPQAAAGQGQGQVNIAGSIGAINGSTIFVTGDDGAATTVALQKDTLILGRKPSTLDSIRPGEAMGVTSAKADDGSLTATIINVFSPELWQKVRKGQWQMDSGLYMTNAQVDRLSAGVKGRTLYMKYQMLTAAIAVPESAEVHRMVSMRLADLKPGMKVSVRGVAGSDGAVAASIISFELPGT
jgi:hypothetical protein